MQGKKVLAGETKTNRIILATKRTEKKKNFYIPDNDKIARVPGTVLVLCLLVTCTLNYTSLLSAVLQSYIQEQFYVMESQNC